MWGSNDTNSPLNCSCVFPSPPDFCSPLLLPVCRLEATSSSSSFSRTNLSGHNRLPLQLCCFWNGNPFSPACSPSRLTEISQKDTLLWGIYSISPLSTDSRFFFSFPLSGCLFAFTHQCGSCVIVATQLGISSICEVIQLYYHLQYFQLEERDSTLQHSSVITR